MKTKLVASVAVLALLATALPGLSAPGPKDKEKGKTDPAGVALELRIVGKKTDYVLDRGGKTPAEFLKQFEDGKKTGNYPPAPAVDLQVVLRNTGKTDLKVWVQGDPCVLELRLEGKGAINATPRIFFTAIFIGPRELTLGPGKTYTLPVKSLSSGRRGQSKRAFWTEAGTYALTASYRTAVFPQPKGAKMVSPGWGQVTITSAPFTLRVTAK